MFRSECATSNPYSAIRHPPGAIRQLREKQS